MDSAFPLVGGWPKANSVNVQGSGFVGVQIESKPMAFGSTFMIKGSGLIWFQAGKILLQGATWHGDEDEEKNA